VRWHEVAADHRTAGEEVDGQQRLLKPEAIGIVQASREKRDSIGARVAKMLVLRAEDPGAHRLLWHDLEAERAAIERAVPAVVSVWGSQPLEDRARAFKGFKEGIVRELATKPVIAGGGCNFQKHCRWAIFLGIGFKFRDFIQAIHRLQRFGQLHEVRVDLIYSEAERAVRAELERKWRDHEAMCARMSEIIRAYGLGLSGATDILARTVEEGGAERVEQGDGWTVYRNDTVIRTAMMEPDSVGLIVTSIPFSTQYEYTPSYNDFGHSDDSPHFFRQMDYLTPELLRVLQPGRKLCVHVKDRVRPGGMEGVGFQTVDPFHAECIAHYRRHGFFYMGMITVETDVVRENNQTYRLGWTEKCKDGSRMSVGMPEYVLLFRKAPSDSSNGYADVPVVKAKADYPRARWQIDAHAKWRSSGERLLAREDLAGLPARDIYRRFRAAVTASVYDHEWHVGLNQGLEDACSLPSGFALLPPHAWHPDIWSDVARMRTLNGEQAAKGREMHLCPLQFDIVDRLIVSDSNPGDVVFDPFGGLMTVPLRAVKLGRRGLGVELNPAYFDDAVRILRDADRERATPSLFDLIAAEEASADGEDDVREMMEAAE
jgi:DNA modification methylase